MKKSIAWHKQCLRNRLDSIDRKRVELDRLAYDIEACERDVKFLAFQIEAAEKAGKDGFDQDKYLVSRPNKTIQYK